MELHVATDRLLVRKNPSKQFPANNLKLREKEKNVPFDNPTVGTEVESSIPIWNSEIVTLFPSPVAKVLSLKCQTN